MAHLVIFKKNPSEPPMVALPAEVIAEVQDLIWRDQVIKAIKVVRTRSTLSLKEAKDLVDAMKLGYVPPTAPSGYVPQQPAAGLTPDVLHQVQHLINNKKKIQAIKIIRDHTHMSLKHAKDLADAMERGQFQPLGTPRSLADRARAFRDAGDPDRAAALIQVETGMSRDEAVHFVNSLT